MCLGMPMQIVGIDGCNARIQFADFNTAARKRAGQIPPGCGIVTQQGDSER